jgi:hypothetical protein
MLSAQVDPEISFPKGKDAESSTPLQLIHSDVCGPMHITGMQMNGASCR